MNLDVGHEMIDFIMLVRWHPALHKDCLDEDTLRFGKIIDLEKHPEDGRRSMQALLARRDTPLIYAPPC